MGGTRKLVKGGVRIHKNDWRDILKKLGFVQADSGRLKELLVEIGRKRNS